MIVVDPGHGGADPGCRANGLIEKELTLHTALLIRKLSGTVGVPLCLTRDADETLGLAARGRRAAAFGTDQVVCLHFDTNPDPGVGRLTCYCNESDRRSRRLAARVIAAAPPILTSGSRTIFVEATGWKRRACHVVRAYQAPTLLVECAFLSNHQHQTFLQAPLGLPGLATGLLCALLTTQASTGDTSHYADSSTFLGNAALDRIKGPGPVHPAGKRSLVMHAKKHFRASRIDAGANQDEESQIAILTLSEACELLRISRATMFSLLARKSIPAKKVGRCWRFDRMALIRWFRGKVASRTQGGQS